MDSDFSMWLGTLGGPSEIGLSRLLQVAEVATKFQEPAAWGSLCKFAMDIDEAHELSQSYQRGFSTDLLARGPIEDNDLIGAIAAIRLGIHKRAPVMAWAAYNKHSFPGFAMAGMTELSLMRILQWAGADVSMPDENTGMTALHHMASIRYGNGSDPRAVEWLLKCGASPNARNENGDTPMAYLCGTEVWGEAQRATFLMLLKAGSDPRAASNDGSTALDLLKQTQAGNPSPMRQTIIESLEADIAQTKPGFFGRMLGIGKLPTWSATLAH